MTDFNIYAGNLGRGITIFTLAQGAKFLQNLTYSYQRNVTVVW